MVESSAYTATCDCRASGRSLINKRKRVGPKIDPCGTSELILLLYLFTCIHPEDCHANGLSPIGNSNHCLVSVDISFQSPVATAPPIYRTVCQYGKADWDGFRDFLNDVPWSYVLSLDPNSAAAELNEWINMAIDAFVPPKKFQLKAYTAAVHPCLCCSNCPSYYFNLHSCTKTDESHRLFKLARNRCKRVLDQAKLEYAEHVRNNISIQQLGTRDFWRTANSVLNNNKSAIPPLFQGPI